MLCQLYRVVRKVSRIWRVAGVLFIPLTWISADGRTSDHNSLKTCSVHPPLHSQCFVFVYIFGKKSLAMLCPPTVSWAQSFQLYYPDQS